VLLELVSGVSVWEVSDGSSDAERLGEEVVDEFERGRFRDSWCRGSGWSIRGLVKRSGGQRAGYPGAFRRLLVDAQPGAV
jgi:hypothetical protein